MKGKKLFNPSRKHARARLRFDFGPSGGKKIYPFFVPALPATPQGGQFERIPVKKVREKLKGEGAQKSIKFYCTQSVCAELKVTKKRVIQFLLFENLRRNPINFCISPVSQSVEVFPSSSVV